MTTKSPSYSNEIATCRNCTGIINCKQSAPGFEPVITTYQFNGEEVSTIEYRKCQFKLQREAEAKLQQLFDESGLPVRSKDLTLKDAIVSETLKLEVGNFILGKMDMLELIDQYQAAVAIGNEFIRRGIRTKFVTVNELITDLRYTDNNDYVNNLKQYITVPKLIIIKYTDFVFTDYASEQYLMVTERRNRKALQTLICLI